MSNWFNRSADRVLRELNTDVRLGLNEGEAKRRLLQFGFNQLQAAPKISPWRIFIAQFLDFMVLVLIGAAIISGLLGEQADALTILAIVVLNAGLGFVQEYRAEKSLEALKKLASPLAKVVRNGLIKRIPAQEVVPGDILLLESGDRIAADGRLCEAVELEANEAALTGESLSVSKTVADLKEANLTIGDQKNMIFAGTVITCGHGKAVVVATGMKTEIGKIAGMISSVAEGETPLQQRLDQLGRWLIVICLGVCGAVAAMGIIRGEPPRQMFLSAVSLAVAAIPEGLPAIVTIALAIGVQRMIARHAIVRKLPAVETLGCATVICSDKTGTLTQNKLAVTRLWDGVKEYEESGRDFSSIKLTDSLENLLKIGGLCNNAIIEANGTVMGDPTEGALLLGARKFGIRLNQLAQQYQRIGELPFSSERKRMGVWVQAEQGTVELLVKGAADVVLDRCTHCWTVAGLQPLTRRLRDGIKARVDDWGNDALRVLAFAAREGSWDEVSMKSSDPENSLIFYGLMGMTDPPRPESKMAIARAHRAGIQVKMITGDYPQTALAIGKLIGLTRPDGKLITGKELDQLSDKELLRQINQIDIFARVAPAHKLRVVKALKQQGEIVAMTGDGINDAPAIKEADIGVAMGLSGTDVSKEASAMIIADDNFATIVAAVEEGRMIYDNIRKFIRYLLSCNIGEVLTMFGGFLLGLPVVLLPIQILWINLVTDGLPAIALGMEPPEPGVMERPPRSSREGIFSRGLGWRIVWQGMMISMAVLGVFLFKLSDGDLLTARTAAFNVLVFAQLFFAFRCRSERRTFFQMKLKDNPYLIGAVCISTAMQLATTYIPWMQRIFYTTSLDLRDWGIILGVLTVITYTSDLLFQFRAAFYKHLSIFRVKNA